MLGMMTSTTSNMTSLNLSEDGEFDFLFWLKTALDFAECDPAAELSTYSVSQGCALTLVSVSHSVKAFLNKWATFPANVSTFLPLHLTASLMAHTVRPGPA